MRNGNTLLGTFPWRKLDVGGLGFVTGMSISSDGSQMGIVTDVGGAYRWDATEGEWLDLISKASMPAGIIENAAPAGGHNFGAQAVAISNSNPLVWYLFFKDRAFRSANGGVSWADTNLNGTTGLQMPANTAGQKQHQRKAQVDPSNSEVCYFGSHTSGLWRYMSGAWAKCSGVPDATATVAGDRSVIVAIDPTSSLIGSGATSRRSRVYASSFGNGLYLSTDGGDSFSAVTMPAAFPAGTGYGHYTMLIDNSGELFIAFNAGANDNLYRRVGTTWTHVASVGASRIVRALSFDPKNANRFVALGSGSAPLISLDDMATWQGVWNASQLQAVATDVPIIADVLNSSFAGSAGFSSFCIETHPVQNRDYLGMGLGVCYFDSTTWPATPSTGNKLTLVELSKGIEELVAHSAHISRTGTAHLGSHDKAIISIPERGVYPTKAHPPATLAEGFAIDSAIDDPNHIAFVAIRGTNFSGTSDDDGRTINVFDPVPTTAGGGSIAVGNKGQMVIFPGQNGHPRYWTGSAWADCSFAGVTFPATGSGTGSGWGFGNAETRRHIVCADKDTPGTFYALCVGAQGQVAATQGLWKSTDAGANWSRIISDPIIPAVSAGFHAQLLYGGNGVLYASTGDTGSFFTKDSAAQAPVVRIEGTTMTTLPNISEALIAVGAPAPGSANKTLYMIGWDETDTYGLFMSTDKGATKTALTPFDTFDQTWALAADPVKFGRLITGYSGTGWRERTYEYTMRLS